MTPRDLIAALGTLAEASDGMERLRELVLQLAVRGHIVPSLRSEKPVSPADVDRVSMAGAASGKILRKHRATNQQRAKPAPIRNWVSAPLGSLLDELLDFRGRTPKKLGMEWGGGNIPALSALNVRDGGIDPAKTKHFGSLALYEKWMTQGDTERGDVLLTMEAPLGNVAQIPDDKKYLLSQRVVLLKSHRRLLAPGFLAWSMRSPAFQQQLRSSETGTTAKGIRASRLVKLSLLLPPLAEQKRIVARVDELMGLLDKLEAARNAREATRAALRDAALAALQNADTPEDVELAWNRIAERMHDLFTDPADIPPLRQTILQLAARGRLVPQDPNDESASVLLGKRSVVPGVSEIPFSLPGGWAWTCISRLGDVRGGATPSKRNGAYWDGCIPWVSPKDMKRDFIGESQDYITEAAVAESSAKPIPAGSLLMVIRGMILAHSFPVALTTVVVTINQDMKALLPFDGRLSPFLLVAGKGHKARVLSLVKRSTHGTCKLPTDDLLSMLFAVPPLAEQERIVARVEELMGLLDKLEQQLSAQTATHDAFAGAAVHYLDA